MLNRQKLIFSFGLPQKIIAVAILVFLVALSAIFLLPDFAWAAAGDSAGGWGITVLKVLRVILMVLGIIAIGAIIYAGWLWMRSEGDEEIISETKLILIYAGVALAIILIILAILSFFISRSEINGGGPGGGPGGSTSVNRGIPALGSGIIASHYPGRDQTGLPRNVKIAVTFKEAIDPGSFMAGDNQLNNNNIKVYKSVDGLEGSVVKDIIVQKSGDNKTFVLEPKDNLGNDQEITWYTVSLLTGLAKAGGQPAFLDASGPVGYEWSFAVDTFIDNTPPRVNNVLPAPGSSQPRNVVVQINFNEPINPLTASGATGGGFNNIIVQSGEEAVAGNYYIANQYRSVEFLPAVECGTNSCGDIVYCLPPTKEIKTLIRAASLAFSGDAFASFPFNGIVDMAGNSLDGNSNGEAQGPEVQSSLPPFDPAADQDISGDDYAWSFNTSGQANISPPRIKAIKPDSQQQRVDLNSEIYAQFNKIIANTSITTNTAARAGSVSLTPTINFWIEQAVNQTTGESTIYLKHDPLNEGVDYQIGFNSGIRDIYQNCYIPCSGNGCIGSPSCCDGQPSADGICAP